MPPDETTPEPNPKRTPKTLKADALQLPGGYGGNQYLQRIKADFAGLFPEGARLFTRTQGSWYFVSANPDDTLLFPSEHQRSGQDRYVWTDHPTIKNVKIGTLVPDESV